MLAGSEGTGGASSAACSLARMDNCESEAWRKRIKLKRRVKGVLSCTGGVGGRFSSLADHEGRESTCWTAFSSAWSRCSAERFRRDLSERLKRAAGSRALRRWRSLSLRFGRRGRRGIAVGGGSLAAHERGRVSHSAGHGTVGGEGVGVGVRVGRETEKTAAAAEVRRAAVDCGMWTGLSWRVWRGEDRGRAAG